jgi:hypothetical protein
MVTHILLKTNSSPNPALNPDARNAGFGLRWPARSRRLALRWVYLLKEGRVKRMFIKCLLMFAYFLTTAAWSDIGFRIQEPSFKGGKALLLLSIEKTIKPEDYENVAKVANLLLQSRFNDQWAVLAKLDSTGGSTSAALKIGRFLRGKQAMAIVDDGAACFSSCVYILAGASNRAVEGQIGIHRPYEPNDLEISEIAQKKKYQKLGKDIMAYLQEMNIPIRLYEDSLFISPDRIKILTAEELQGYGLNENDPYADEASAVNQAKKLGISRKEYAAREARSRNECGLGLVSNETPADEVISRMNCRTAILEGKR